MNTTDSSSPWTEEDVCSVLYDRTLSTSCLNETISRGRKEINEKNKIVHFLKHQKTPKAWYPSLLLGSYADTVQ